MKPRIKQVIEQIQASGGIIDLAEDLDDFIVLDRLLDAQDDAASAEHIDLLQRPAAVGTLLLHRLSWGAIEWLRTAAGPWWEHDPDMYALAMIYAHTHANQPDAFDHRLTVDCRHARRTIKRFMRTVPESVEVLAAAIDRMNAHRTADQDATDQDTEPDTASQADILVRLVREYNRPPEFFLYEISQDILEIYIQRMCARESEELNRLAQLHDRQIQSDPDSPQAIAFRRVAQHIKHLTAKCIARKKEQPSG
jgi:hypothetical protein